MIGGLLSGRAGLTRVCHYDKDGLKMAFFSLGDHHDFAISQVAELGNGIELYIDASDAWREDPSRLVSTLEPLDI